MGVISIIIIGIALAMDAFGVSLSIGINSYVDRRKKIEYILSFAFFQFLFSFLGGLIGYLFDTYIVSIPKLLGGGVIGLIGIFMILDGVKTKDESLLLKDSMILVIGISVSIDALIVGFTAFHQLGSIPILLIDTILIGLITLLISTIGFFICRYVRKISFVAKYADFLGGITLILLALNMIFF